MTLILLTTTSIAQNCDSTRLFKEAIIKSINYNDSLTKLTELPSPSKGIIGNNIYIVFFYESAKYLPEKIGKYTIHKMPSKQIEKIYKENYKKAKTNNDKDYAQYEIGGGLQHIDKNRVNVYISFSRRITEIEDDTLGVLHEIVNSYFMQESIYTYKYDCNKQKFILERQMHSRGHNFEFNKARYKQKGKSLYKRSLELFMKKLSSNLKSSDTFKISQSYLLYEPWADSVKRFVMSGVNMKYMYFEDEQYYYANRIPFKFLESIVWECNGQLVYTIYYKKHKKAFLQKNVVEKFLYTGNYYYQFNCTTDKWELVRTEFLKPNKRVKWK